jgi:Spy/CpxP family protein refolding chaperone
VCETGDARRGTIPKVDEEMRRRNAMRHRIIPLAVAAIVVGLTAMWAMSDTTTQPPMRGHHGMGHVHALWSQLNLTPDQKTKIEAIKSAHKDRILAAGQDVMTKRHALFDAVTADKPDEAAIRKAADDLGKAIGNASVTASAIVAEVRPILTAEQIDTARKFLAAGHRPGACMEKCAIKAAPK